MLVLGEALDVEGDDVDDDVAHALVGGVEGEVEAIEAGVGAGGGVVAAGEAADFEGAGDPGGPLEVLEAAGGESRGARNELEESCALVCVESVFDDAPEVLAALVVGGDVAVVGVGLPVVDVDFGEAEEDELEFLGVQQFGGPGLAGDGGEGDDVVEAPEEGREGRGDAVHHGVFESELDVRDAVLVGDVDAGAAGYEFDFFDDAEEGLFADCKGLAQKLDVVGVLAGQKPREVRVEGGVDELEVVEFHGLAQNMFQQRPRQGRGKDLPIEEGLRRQPPRRSI
mmetsp:Transcript_23031/g.74094  ORF Transcript_23031/g.74094 Transcript_23031/m.74094 type:complete len:283 (+) Transcript_23031:182-1030(+)